MKHYLLVTILLSIFLVVACRKDPPIVPPDQPPTTCTYPPGNRNFTWRLDTVAWFLSTVAGVWVFSDTDAYVIGYIIDGKPPYTLRPGRHWNGKFWGDSINGTWGFDNATEIWGDIRIDLRNDVTGDDHFMVAAGFWGDKQDGVCRHR
jgi:hypothetical protein